MMQVSTNYIWTKCYNFFNERAVKVLSSMEAKIVLVAIAALAILALACRCSFQRKWVSLFDKPKDSKMVKLVNINPERSLIGQGIHTIDEVLDFVHKNGKYLTSLDLRAIKSNDDEFKGILDCCPNLTHLVVPDGVTDAGLDHLQGRCIKSLAFLHSDISQKGFSSLKGITLETIEFTNCKWLTELSFLKGMPLKSIKIDGCLSLKSATALKDLKGLPLKCVKIIGPSDLQDDDLANLKGMPLEEIFIESTITDKAFSYLVGMPLQRVSFISNHFTDHALADLKGMQLKSITLGDCSLLTGKGLEYLAGMPLEEINIYGSKELLDSDFARLKGMPLREVYLACPKLTGRVLAHFHGMPLKDIGFSCGNLTNDDLKLLKGIPLESVTLIDCNMLTDDGLIHFVGMPLKIISLFCCKNFTNGALAHLRKLPLEKVYLSGTNISKVDIAKFKIEMDIT